MEKYWSSSNYGNDIEMTEEQARRGYHQGDCEPGVTGLLSELESQLSKLDPETLRVELKGYGAWTDEELANHKENILRWVWLSCGDVTERLDSPAMFEATI